MSQPYRIMTVCTGNICRSPMAEQMLKEELAGANVQIDSAGMSSEEEGNPIHPRASKVLARHDYLPAPEHAAKTFSAADFASHDLILAMDTNHYGALLDAAPDDESRSKVHLIREFDPAADPADLGIRDPWHGGISDYEDTFDLLSKSVPGVAEYVAQ